MGNCMGKGVLRVREKMPKYFQQYEDETLEYTLQAEEEEPYYTPQPEDKDLEYTPQSDDEMVEENFNKGNEDDLQINYGIVSVLPTEYDRVS